MEKNSKKIYQNINEICGNKKKFKFNKINNNLHL